MPTERPPLLGEVVPTFAAINCYAFTKYPVHLQLPATFIDCTSEIIDEDIKYAATNGHLAQELAMNGTMHMFADNDASAKVGFIFILDVDITRFSPFHMPVRRKETTRKI
jgi:hypothetical protein